MNAPRQRCIGLTGGIATGKSSVGRILASEHGLPVLDADRYAREALGVGQPAAAAVLQRFGERVRRKDGGIDRPALGRIVFRNADERRWLEGLVHPLVRDRFDAALSERSSAPVVVLMIPLLFEAGLEPLCSEIWLVDCDEEQQRQRLMAREGGDEADALTRIAAQWPLARKRVLADVVIDNRGPADHLQEQVRLALGAGPSRPRTPR